jgi:hypothetical protein
MTDPSILSISPIERPRCPRCQLRMRLARREYRGNGVEKRTFKCAKCDLVETKIVDDALQTASGRRARCSYVGCPPPERRQWKTWRRIWKSFASTRRNARLSANSLPTCKSESYSLGSPHTSAYWRRKLSVRWQRKWPAIPKRPGLPWSKIISASARKYTSVHTGTDLFIYARIIPRLPKR